MVEQVIQVTEQMADFVQWANEKGREEITRMVGECVDYYKSMDGKQIGNIIYRYDPVLDRNNGVDQWKHGGDCNMCRKAGYCMKKCRANRTLKGITTPYLYQKYLEDHPEVEASKAAKSITPEDVANLVNAQ